MNSRSERISKLFGGSGRRTGGRSVRARESAGRHVQQDGKVVCQIHPAKGLDHTHYGLVICDLVRHVARAFRVDEDEVWKWVDKERRHPTTDVTQPS